MPTYRTGRLDGRLDGRSGGRLDGVGRLPQRTINYIAHGASEGTRNDELFAAAQQARDAGMTEGAAVNAFLGRALADGLSESEARRAIQSAFSSAPREACGKGTSGFHVLPKSSLPKASGATVKYKLRVVRKEKEHDLGSYDELKNDDRLSSPEAIHRFLFAAFEGSEKIGVSPTAINADGERKPTNSKWYSRDQLCDLIKVGTAGGDNHGLYLRINPGDGQGCGDANVTSMRHLLIEFDEGERSDQFDLLSNSGLPITAMIDSGDKSIHALVRVDAKNREEYHQHYDRLRKHFPAMDRSNRNPSRLSRFPGALRTLDDGSVVEQKLLALNLNAAAKIDDWYAEREVEETDESLDEETDESLDEALDALPAIQDASEFFGVEAPQTPPWLIEGLMHEQLKMVIGGPSKSQKSWNLLNLGAAMTLGQPWMGFETCGGNVLYVNLELQPWMLRQRLEYIYGWHGRAGGPATDDPGRLLVWDLRNHRGDIAVMISAMLRQIIEADVKLVIIDPIYKTLGDRDENAAGDMNNLMEHIDRLVLEAKVGTAFSAHFSKGGQSSKAPMDRMSGSGVIARDPDVIMVMTEHEEEFCMTCDFVLRGAAPVRPFVARWTGADPAMGGRGYEIDASLCPENLAGASETKSGGRKSGGRPAAGNSRNTYRMGKKEEMEERKAEIDDLLEAALDEHEGAIPSKAEIAKLALDIRSEFGKGYCANAQSIRGKFRSIIEERLSEPAKEPDPRFEF